PFDQGLFFAGILLEDHRRTFSYYNITQDFVLYFGPISRGCMKVYFETISGKRIPVDVKFVHTAKELKAYSRQGRYSPRPTDVVHLEVESIDTIKNVKAKIQDKQGVPANKQTLFLPQKHLQDDSALADYFCPEGKRPRREYRAVFQEGKRPVQERHPTQPTGAACRLNLRCRMSPTFIRHG
nr:hypothetical protein [Tanacetum cinerariifolium]